MGNSGSTAPQKGTCLDDFLNDFTVEYPGIELQLEDAYKALTGCDSEDSVDDNEGDYLMVEPVIRHFLFTMGLGEHIGKFVDNENRLRISEILPLLKAVGIRFDATQKLNLDDWKILLVAWTRRIEEEQRHNLEKWHAHLEEMQREQQRRFDASLDQFKRSYLDQIHAYHEAVGNHYRQEQNYRKQWEEHQSMQLDFKDRQLNYVAHMNETARQNFRQRIIATQQMEIIRKLGEETKAIQRDPMEGADKVSAFIYPVTLNKQSGAPISAGAYVPQHRPRLVTKSS